MPRSLRVLAGLTIEDPWILNRLAALDENMRTLLRDIAKECGL